MRLHAVTGLPAHSFNTQLDACVLHMFVPLRPADSGVCVGVFRPAPADEPAGDVAEGWRHVMVHRPLRGRPLLHPAGHHITDHAGNHRGGSPSTDHARDHRGGSPSQYSVTIEVGHHQQEIKSAFDGVLTRRHKHDIGRVPIFMRHN